MELPQWLLPEKTSLINEFKMENSTIIINLEPSGSQAVDRTSATYEEAFLGGGSEEMSNARGRGRARRKKRKLERIANKREVRTERRKLKSDRQEERLARRRKRKQTRQEMRDEQQEARMERRNKRREDRENRRGNEPEGDEEDEDTQTTQETGGSDDRGEDTGSTGGSSTSYEEDEDEDTGSDDYASDEDEDEDAGSDDYASDEDEDDASFNGVNYDFDGESSEFISEATGKTSVSPMVQEICMKIEWNNEMLMRLANKKKQMLAQGKDVSAVNSAIDQKFDRVQSLENKLENFAGADGKVDRKRAKEIRLGKQMARRKRLAMASDMIPPVLVAKLIKRGLSKEQIQEWWAKKGKKRFGKSSFDGETNVDDRVIITDEPVDTENWGMPSAEFDVDLGGGEGYDPMSFATGETSGSGNFWKSVLVGVVVGGVLIYAIRKYKLLKD